jgi:hypothetical protein
MIGCTSNTLVTPKVKPTIQQPAQETVQIKQGYVAQKQRKHITLKKVETQNYADSYMYPEDTHTYKKKVEKKHTVAPALQETPPTPAIVMDKPECIAMIGEEKFNKYTTMFGSESASIKRCRMLKAMKK